jgi:hypothetical protein
MSAAASSKEQYDKFNNVLTAFVLALALLKHCSLHSVPSSNFGAKNAI